jgi:hypothetical protein
MCSVLLPQVVKPIAVKSELIIIIIIIIIIKLQKTAILGTAPILRKVLI